MEGVGSAVGMLCWLLPPDPCSRGDTSWLVLAWVPPLHTHLLRGKLVTLSGGWNKTMLRLCSGRGDEVGVGWLWLCARLGAKRMDGTANPPVGA